MPNFMKSEGVGFFLVDLVWNDPNIQYGNVIQLIPNIVYLSNPMMGICGITFPITSLQYFPFICHFSLHISHNGKQFTMGIISITYVGIVNFFLCM